jgi:tetratricopeptide (TPR) repeat protein
MTDDLKTSEKDRAEAARLFAEAQAAQARDDYRHARECYQRSLELDENPTVRAAYLDFMALVGPM